jgi:hypothetical protein
MNDEDLNDSDIIKKKVREEVSRHKDNKEKEFERHGKRLEEIKEKSGLKEIEENYKTKKDLAEEVRINRKKFAEKFRKILATICSENVGDRIIITEKNIIASIGESKATLKYIKKFSEDIKENIISDEHKEKFCDSMELMEKYPNIIEEEINIVKTSSEYIILEKIEMNLPTDNTIHLYEIPDDKNTKEAKKEIKEDRSEFDQYYENTYKIDTINKQHFHRAFEDKRMITQTQQKTHYKLNKIIKHQEDVFQEILQKFSSVLTSIELTSD